MPVSLQMLLDAGLLCQLQFVTLLILGGLVLDTFGAIRTIQMVLGTAAASAAALGVALPLFVVKLLSKMHSSVGLAPPTLLMLEQEARDGCALFRHLPELRSKVAWRSLDAARTPVHRCRVDGSSGTIEVLVKREDLAHPMYGGNKVRTLQHQLAVIEARSQVEPRFRNVYVVGSGGSNQVVATAVHACRLGLPPVHVLWLDRDEPDLDNTLNMLSTLSLPIGSTHDWGALLSSLRALWSASFGGGGVVLPVGGNNPSGVLGQLSAALELAEQIEAGETDDPKRIYVAVGSSCTVSGIVLGIVLAQRLGLKAFQHEDFKLVGTIVEHKLAFLERKIQFHRNKFARHVPLSISHSIASTCAELLRLGGPDLLPDALRFVHERLELLTQPELVGLYGTHSQLSLAAAQVYDRSGRCVDGADEAAPGLWLCGHFAAKAFAPLLSDAESGQHKGAPLLLWMTKSAVQPRGKGDEWSAMLSQNDAVREWADAGEAKSALRPGKVDTATGTPLDYRSLMTDIDP